MFEFLESDLRMIAAVDAWMYGMKLVDVIMQYMWGRGDSYLFAIVAGMSGAQAGVGKTTYAYSALKYALFRSLAQSDPHHGSRLVKYRQACIGAIHARGLPTQKPTPLMLLMDSEHVDSVLSIDACREYAAELYITMNDLDMWCVGSTCSEPDKVDKMLMDGDENLMMLSSDMEEVAAALQEVAEGRRKPYNIVFMDDVGIYTTAWWHGKERELYLIVRDFAVHRRGFAKIIVATALDSMLVAKPIKRSAYMVYATDAKPGEAKRFVKFKRVAIPLYTAGRRHIKIGYDIDWVDTVPNHPLFALPRWLEELDMKRKRSALARSINKYFNDQSFKQQDAGSP